MILNAFSTTVSILAKLHKYMHVYVCISLCVCGGNYWEIETGKGPKERIGIWFPISNLEHLANKILFSKAMH